jgi:hypothetical protein
MKKSVLKQLIKFIISESSQKNNLYLGFINKENFRVFGWPIQHSFQSHQDFYKKLPNSWKMVDAKPWRYRKDLNTVYWWNSPNETEKMELLNWAKQKFGINTTTHKIINTTSLDDKDRMASHSLKESQGISNNQVRYGTNCTGISHGVSTDPRSIPSVRDELNDPIMNGKLHEGQYRFDDFTYLKRGDGFGIPSDVYYGTILLGVIVSQENGYLIGIVKGPNGDRSYKQDPKKPFKTKDDAAEALHRAWKSLRHGEETKYF